MDHTQRFDGLARVYAAGRPTYARGLLDALYGEYGLSAASVIADVGAGTGKLTGQLLERGSFVYCVEPSADMRGAAARALGGCPRCRVVNGTAEATTLEAASVDCVTAAQAFHWFDPLRFRRECRRILREKGPVFLIWNIRDPSDPVNRDSFRIFSEYCPAFRGFGGGIQKDDARIRQLFEHGYAYREFEHPLCYEQDGFLRRSLSGSYSLRPGDARYPEYLRALSALFDRYAEDGVLHMANQTVVYVGTVD